MNAETNIESRIFGVQWIRLDSHAFWVKPRLNPEKPYGLHNIESARAYVEAGALSGRKKEEHFDRRLSDGLIYSVMAMIATPLLFGPVAFLLAMVTGVLFIRRDAKGILAIDLTMRGGSEETVRIWDVSKDLLAVASELQEVTGGPREIGTR